VAQAKVASADDWHRLVEGANLGGPLGQLAQNAVLTEVDGVRWTLALKPVHMQLAVEPMVQRLQQRLAEITGQAVKLRFVSSEDVGGTVAERKAQARDARQAEAERALGEDPLLRRLQDELGARVVPQSIRPLEN
jgi:DNA polymerase-3 subunit gamma/tau